MAQHDYVIDNSTGANVRADINSVLQAISSNNSGSSAPSTTYALQTFANTTDSMLQLRNAANNAFVNLRKFDGALPLPDGSASSPSLFFDDDTNTGLFSSAADTLNFTTGGVERMELGTATVFNEDGADVDFRIEGDTDANLFYVDAGNDRIGIGTSSPSAPMHIVGSGNTTILKVESTDDDANVGPIIELFRNSASPADNDELGRIDFRADDASGGDSTFARIAVTALDVTNNTEDARIDFTAVTNDTFTPTMSITGQKVGIGITSPNTLLHIQDAAISGYGSQSSTLLVVEDSGDTSIEIASGFNNTGSIFFGDTGSSNKGQINYLHGSGGDAMSFHANGSERMRIDSSGNVGIGATSMQYLVDIHGASGNAKLNLQRTNGADNGNAYGSIFFSNSAGNSNSSIIAHRESGEDNAYLAFQTSSGGTLAERARISSTGNVLIGTTTESGSTDNGLAFFANGAQILKATGSSDHDFLDFYRGTDGSMARVGHIRATGSSTAYNTSSDYRLKENVTAISDGITRLKTLKPYRFNFKIDPDKIVDGFFAHEVTAVPEAVTGTKDEVDSDNKPVYQGIDQSKLVPLLVAAVQELIGKVEALEAA